MLGVGAMIRVPPSLLAPAEQPPADGKKPGKKFELIEPPKRVIAKPEKGRRQATGLEGQAP